MEKEKEKEFYLENEGDFIIIVSRVLPMSVPFVIISRIRSVESYGRRQAVSLCIKDFLFGKFHVPIEDLDLAGGPVARPANACSSALLFFSLGPICIDYHW